jgi:tetratricopeptide (TPR) repeat protein
MATATPGTAGRARAATIIERSPGVVPCAISCGVLLWFAGDEGGFRGTTWEPAMLFLLGVLFVCLIALPRPRPSRAALTAVLLLGAYGVWSLMSVLWAGQEELAWDAGNRTLLYALILALCTLWPIRGEAAAVILGALGLGIAAIALVELLKVSGSSQGIQYFHEARFAEPVGYTNANVALWMIGLFPCAVLGGRRGVPAPLRGLFLGSAVLLAGAALIGQSRGWLIVLPAVAVIAIAVVPGRGRTIVSFAAVGVALLPALSPLLDVYTDWHAFRPPGEVWDSALRALLLASIGLGMVGTLAAMIDVRVPVSAGGARRISAAAVAAVVLAVAAGTVGYAVVERSPISAASDAWNEFKKGGSDPVGHSVRLGSGFSTYRYDYWRIAWREFKKRPILGNGADNFGRAYLRHGESTQTPRFPHSTVLAALSETGIIGALLLLGAFAAGLMAAFPALRRVDLGGVAAGTGVLLFLYWFVHSSLDWFWEFPGLAGPGLLGLGVAMAVAHGAKEPAPERSLISGGRALALAVACVVLIAASVIPPWLSERELRRGTEIAATNPEAALEDFDRAASLNPLTPLPDKAAGVVEIRDGDYAAADRSFRAAYERDHGDSGMHLLMGVLASSAGRPQEAIRLVSEARRLAPQDEITARVLNALKKGRKLDPRKVDRLIQANVERRIGPE